jgi:hypothetical protein
MKIKISALKRFPKSKKYTFTKVPAQKAPDRFSSLEARDVKQLEKDLVKIGLIKKLLNLLLQECLLKL